MLWKSSVAEPMKSAAEQSQFTRTGRYAEVQRMCQSYAQNWPGSVRWEKFGVTPQGRDMVSVIASTSGCLTPQQARGRGLPVVLVQGGIHAGEIDGKDAGFLALRQLLEKNDPLLKDVVVVFVPVLNVDGHERFGPHNRPNQNGPAEMGWRVTSHNLNLNRDYAKAESPEMQQMLELLNRWDPELYVDLHVTDGAQFQTEVAVLIEPTVVGQPSLHEKARQLQSLVLQELGQQKIQAVGFYPALRDPNNPLSGFAEGAYPARFSTGYWALRNRFAVLVETHSWKSYPRRVKVTLETVRALLLQASRQGRTWRSAMQEADRQSQQLGGQQVALTFENTPKSENLDFLGYAFRYEPSKVSGAQALVYDPSSPQVWKVPYYKEVVPKTTVRAPLGGYLIPPSYASWLGSKLSLHGISFCHVRQARGLSAQQFRADQTEFGARPYEGHMTLTVRGNWENSQAEVRPGWIFVPIAQPNSRLLLTLMEPTSGDSFLNWGYFNAHFEQKEYMEDYVAEEVGQQMLQSNPELARQFEERLAKDPDFAKSASARLDFFYRRHPSYDQQLNVYPVLRTDLHNL